MATLLWSRQPEMNVALQRGQQAFLDRYAGLRDRLPGSPDARDRAAASFSRLGLPDGRVEAWKYTTLRSLDEIAFAEPVISIDADAASPDVFSLAGVPALVFVDGRFRADLSDSLGPSAAELFSSAPEFGPLARPDRDAFAALNTMLAEDGVRITVPAGVDAGIIQLVNWASDIHQRPVGIHPRHRIELGDRAKLVLVDVSAGEGVYLHNMVDEIVVGRGAALHHLRLQEDAEQAFYVGTLYAEVAADGLYDSFLLNVGARLSRNEVHARIAGNNAEVVLNCAQLLRGAQHGDFTTVVAHDAPAGRSRQTVRQVLGGSSRGVFQGRIEVARVAQKTDGYQMNHALLLSPDAEVDTKPELRINADDVKCSHGATVGELDDDQLFYMRSRGVNETEAREMLVRGFLAESLASIQDESVRELFEAAVERWWRRSAS